jgi:LDH2 family malate/lactate/ureidoglycolate dehydrogenase
LVLAIKIESFIDVPEFKEEIQILTDWVKSSPTMPGVKRIYVPGEKEAELQERRKAEGIFIEENTWDKLVEIATTVNVSVPTLS